MSWDGVHDLVRRARSGDQEAWRQLHDLAQGFLAARARRLLGNGRSGWTVDALVLDTWQQIFPAFDTFRGGSNDAETGAMLRAWLSRAMSRVHFDGRDKSAANGLALPIRLGPFGSSTAAPDPPADDPSPSHPLRAAEEREQIHQALAKLPDEERRVVELTFFQGRTLEQVAAELNLTFDQVRYRVTKALTRLGGALGGLT
jgi:RNA polymerase sigma factor (sigma-70 family)